MKKIVILIGFMPDPRIKKRAELEKNIGELHIVCWDKGRNTLSLSDEAGYTTHTVFQKADINPLKRIPPYLKFSRKALKLLNEIQPDIVHVSGLDMLKIACKYQDNSKKKVSILYEVADLHKLLVDKQNNPVKRIAQIYLRHEEQRLKERYVLLLLTSMQFYEIYFNQFVPKERVCYMPNVPDLTAFSRYQKKMNDSGFTIGYIGTIRYKQQMRNLIEAAKRCNIKVLIAGYENDPVEIEPLCMNNPNIEWVGRFDFNKQAAELYGKCDVMYSVYDANMHNVRVALPNKLYEAVYCEMPLIVAKNTYLAQVVEEWGVGVAVDHKSVDELADALKELRDNKALREQIAENCRKYKDEIDLQKYNAQLKSELVQLLEESD